MSTSISKSINHPPSGFNPYAPDPASECIVIRGRSISAQSYSPAKTLKMWKPHWWSTFSETEKTVSKVAAFFVLTPYPHPMMNKCEFQRNWGGGGRGFKLGKLKLHIFSYLGVTLSSGKLALSLLHFPKGILPNNLTDISLSDASLGTQVCPFQALTNQMASLNSRLACFWFVLC